MGVGVGVGARLASSLGPVSPPYDFFLAQMVTQAPRGRAEEWACPVLPTLAQPWNAADSRLGRLFLWGEWWAPLPQQSMTSLFPLY